MGLRQQACQVAKGGGGTGNGFEGSPAAELLVVLGTFFFEAFIHCFGKDRQQLISREASQAARQGCSGLTEPKDVRSRVVKDRCTIIRMEIESSPLDQRELWNGCSGGSCFLCDVSRAAIEVFFMLLHIPLPWLKFEQATTTPPPPQALVVV